MTPAWYSVFVEGKWTTIRTNRGPIGAFRVVLGTWADNLKIHMFKQTAPNRWRVNDGEVVELVGINMSA